MIFKSYTQQSVVVICVTWFILRSTNSVRYPIREPDEFNLAIAMSPFRSQGQN